MKKGKLYLANRYVYELSIEDEDNTVIINVARKPIFGINKHYLDLAPSKKLTDWYTKNKKKEGWFIEYKKRYKQQIQNDEKALAAMRQIKHDYLDKGIDVMLVCYCREVKKCHRKILGEAYEATGIEVIYK